MFDLSWTAVARDQYVALEAAPARKKQFKAVKKCLKLLSENPRYPGLNTHAWKGKDCPHGETLWEAYAENKTPGAYRVFFCYPPATKTDAKIGKAGILDPKVAPPKPTLMIVAITDHP